MYKKYPSGRRLNGGTQLYAKLGVCRELKVILISIWRNEITILYICSTLTLAFLELGICSISAILESYICFRNFYTLKK